MATASHRPQHLLPPVPTLIISCCPFPSHVSNGSQVGDILDRGPEELKLLYWLERLQQEAQRAGGRLYVLNGNHETMNIHGNYRWVGLLPAADELYCRGSSWCCRMHVCDASLRDELSHVSAAHCC